MLVVAIISVAGLLMPLGKYQSDGEYYQISGLNLLTGTDVMAGTVHIGVSWVMWIAAVASVVLIVDSVIFKKLKPRIAGVIALVSAFVQLIMGLLLLVTMTSILADITASGDITISMDTYNDYMEALEKLFVIQDIDAWCPAIRSKTALRSAPKRCFTDPSIAVASMNICAEALETQLKTFGFIFEQMYIRDLKAYTADFNSRISYYRDRYGLEADLVLHLEDERYALIECKLGSREIEDGAKHLLEIKRLIQEYNNTEKQVPLREPDLLIVLTGGNMAYTRTDGVKVIPLASLRD